MTHPSETMIEKAARALARAAFSNVAPDMRGDMTAEQYVDETWSAFVGDARAVIAAIRVPDGLALWPFHNQAFAGDFFGVRRKKCWEEAIDSILSESKAHGG
jgi:hypothetical protein